MARRPRSAVVSPVAWRDGVHLTGTAIWCDARRRRDICFVSSASPSTDNEMSKNKHGQLVGTPLTLALLDADMTSGHLGVPLYRPFTLGTLRVELIASGRGVGAASLYVDSAGRTVLYASAIRTDVPMVEGAFAIAPADVRTCDAVVVAVPYLLDDDKPVAIAETIERVDAWCRAELAAGRRPALLVDTMLDGVEVAAVLAARGHAIAVGRKIKDAIERIEGATMGGATMAAALQGREPRVTVWLAANRAALLRAIEKYPHSIATVTGRPGIPATTTNFAWPYSAGKLSLSGWLESTSARHVFLTGPGAPSLATALGTRARVIGPPHQMSLELGA